MKKRFVLGLTGGIASGKSAALREFRRLGARTFDCDRIAREVVRPGRPAARAIRGAFGPGVFGKGGRLDRAALGNIVFRSAARRRKLESIVHPEVLSVLKKRIAAAGGGLIVVDVPLLFEAGWARFADKNAVVWAPRKAQIARLKRRNGVSEAQALRLLRAQWPLARKRKLADFVIDNGGSPAAARRQVRELVRRLRG